MISSAILILLALAVLFLFQKLLHRYLNKTEVKERLYGKKETHIKLLGNILKSAVVLITAIAVLQMNGINVSSLIAGLGIASAIAGLALQDMLKDLIMPLKWIPPWRTPSSMSWLRHRWLVRSSPTRL